MAAKYDKYELIERIGSGGMAEIFKARLPGAFGFEKIVVIKRLLPHLAKDPRMVEMFIGEAKLAAHVHHPNVVQVFELGQTGPDNDFFMVMEFIDGTDLRRLIRRARERNLRIPPWFSVFVVAEILDGLAYVHELADKSGRPRNVVHRDVAPDNIFISCFGDVKLGDFGVAKDDLRGIEPNGEQVKGKFAYMAPEQLSGAKIDRRCDVFAAGVVLWECLTQTPLFRGTSTAETINNVLEARRVPPSALMVDIPRELDAPVLNALAIDPDERTASARVMHTELLTVLHQLKNRIGPTDVRRAIDEITGGQVTPPRGTMAPPPPPAADHLGEYEVSLGRAEADQDEVVVDISLSGIDEQADEQPDEHPAPQIAEIAELTPAAARIWEPYSGSHPFWLRGQMASDFGPCSLADVNAIVRAKISEGNESAVDISADHKTWMSLPRYLRLTAQDPSTPSDHSAKTVAAMPMQVANVVSLFENITSRRLTGRVSIDRTGVEIHVVEGRPTHVVCRDPRFEIGGLLVSNHIVSEAQLDECLHTVVAEDRPLRQVVYERTGIDIDEYWIMFMQQRLQPLYEQEIRACTFLPVPPEYTVPFAASLLDFLATQVQLPAIG